MLNKYIEIINNNEIDINGLTLIGASIKDGDSQIGFFGSGNKYAIATLLRNNIDFKIFSGLKEIKIEKKEIVFCDEVFEQIIIDNKETSLTTRMGVDWELWYCLREFISNAKDEKGYELNIVSEINKESEKTKIYIKINEKLEKIINNLNEYILTDEYKPIEICKTHYGEISIYTPLSERFNIYRKGISIYPENNKKCLYWYNFERIEITESRIYKYQHEYSERIASILAVTNKSEIIKNYIKNYENNFECNLNWEYVEDNFNIEWFNILNGNDIYPSGIAQYVNANEDKINSIILPDKLCDKLAFNFPDLHIIGKTKIRYDNVKISERRLKILEKAKEELKAIGFRINYPIEYVETKNPKTVAWYNKELKTVFLVVDFIEEVDYVKKTLLEEYFHSIGYNDGSREFEDYLIELLIESKESKNP